mmetsp:Transcript_91788/g.259811  ORF Transcript_91788/g.259811 Transcript_91788/m.259811 type:complete len:214 (-) Transcript_91788:338-979(-)
MFRSKTTSSCASWPPATRIRLASSKAPRAPSQSLLARLASPMSFSKRAAKSVSMMFADLQKLTPRSNVAMAFSSSPAAHSSLPTEPQSTANSSSESRGPPPASAQAPTPIWACRWRSAVSMIQVWSARATVMLAIGMPTLSRMSRRISILSCSSEATASSILTSSTAFSSSTPVSSSSFWYMVRASFSGMQIETSLACPTAESSSKLHQALFV